MTAPASVPARGSAASPGAAPASGSAAGPPRSGTGVARVALRVLVTFALVWTLVPLGWMLLSSFKPADSVTAPTPDVWFAPTLRNYRSLFSGANDLWPYLSNSALAAGLSALLATALGALAGYGLARTRMRGKQHLSFWIVSTRMAPIAAVVLPIFLIFRFLGLIDTLPGLVLAYLSFNLPFAIWLLSAFFAELPPALEESAQVEGCSHWQAFLHVVLPLTRPGLVTSFVLCLVFSWNDYAFALVLGGPHTQTLPIAAGQLVTQAGIDWGQLTAIGTIVVIPMMLVGLAVRRWLVTGLTMGAVTGE